MISLAEYQGLAMILREVCSHLYAHGVCPFALGHRSSAPSYGLFPRLLHIHTPLANSGHSYIPAFNSGTMSTLICAAIPLVSPEFVPPNYHHQFRSRSNGLVSMKNIEAI
jgi:hypothetical protein